MPRYIFLAGVVDLRVMGESFRQEIWLGVESESAVDLAEFSREHGYHLIPAEQLGPDELRSIGVTKFEPIEDYAADDDLIV